jgi:hypothetical protein
VLNSMDKLKRITAQGSLSVDDVTPNLAIAMKEDPKLAARLRKINFKDLYDETAKPKKRLGIVHDLLGITIRIRKTPFDCPQGPLLQQVTL